MKHDDVTLILQGPLHSMGGLFQRGIANIPIYNKFVGAIVISTWKQPKEEKHKPFIRPSKSFLKDNNAVYTEDNHKHYKRFYASGNVNYQVASSLNGARLVKTKYLIKARCDERYEDLSVFIETMKANPDLLTTQEPFYRYKRKSQEESNVIYTTHEYYKSKISDHVMGGTTEKMLNCFQVAFDGCRDHTFPRKAFPENVLQDCFDGGHVFVSIEDFGDFVFKIKHERITKSMYMKLKGAGDNRYPFALTPKSQKK